jgi:NADPH:quinone reductase-like Zn-dependent oxidoreductase
MRVYEIDPGIRSLDALRQVERADPLPGPSQVLIRVRAAGLNRRDHSVIQGIYAGPPLTRPMIPLSDGAGEVVAAGAAVRRFKIGDRVAGCFFQRWNDGPFTAAVRGSELGAQNDGMLAELVALDEAGVVAIPGHLSFEAAATLPCAAVTAWHALFERGGLKPGEWVLALGTGGVSIAGLQLAKAAGARVIVTSSSDAKLARARALGADGTVNYQATPEWHEAVLDLTGGEGVHHVLEVGGATVARSIEAVRLGGFIHQIGFVSGREIALNLPRFVAKDARWRGVYVGSRAMFEAMNAAIAASRLTPVVDRVFPFEEARAAYAYHASAAHFGKVVIAV